MRLVEQLRRNLTRTANESAMCNYHGWRIDGGPWEYALWPRESLNYWFSNGEDA